jgi:hypothetical protein
MDWLISAEELIDRKGMPFSHIGSLHNLPPDYFLQSGSIPADSNAEWFWVSNLFVVVL